MITRLNHHRLASVFKCPKLIDQPNAVLILSQNISQMATSQNGQ